MNLRTFLLVLLLLQLFTACKHVIEHPEPVNPDACDPNLVYFERDVLPIFVSNCAMSGCHDPGTAQDGVMLNTYENIIQTGDVRPNDPEDSDVYEMITEDDPDKRMPLGGPPLSSEEINMIYTWIEQGAKNLKCNDPSLCDTTSVSFSGDIQPVLNSWCSGCHGSTASGGITLTSYSGASVVATDGRLLGAITHAADFEPMPQNAGMLPECEIAKIRTWIRDGAQNN